MINETKKKKVKKIRLGVFLKNPAKRLYERIGFKKIKDLDHNMILMEKKL